MKLAFAITDCTAAVHVGGQVSTITHVVEIPDELLPPAVREFVDNNYQVMHRSMSVSPVHEHNPQKAES